MKATKFAAFLLAAGLTLSVTSCSEENDETTATITFEGSQWDKLIDNPQYNGPLLYGEKGKEYSWTESFTTFSGSMTNAWGGTYGYAEGGTALSNYIDANITEHNTYQYQLAVPVSNGSQNFVVTYTTATVSFKDGQARQIKSMDICPTTYVLGVITHGTSSAQALTETGSYLTLVITTDKGQTQKVDLARDGNIQKTWKRIDLSGLGKVKSLTFTMEGSDQGQWGLKTPTYFAFDNVVVVL